MQHGATLWSTSGLAWVLKAAGEVPSGRVIGAVLGWARALLVNGFLANLESDLDQVKQMLRQVVGYKVRDPHMSEAERQAMWRMVEEFEAPA